MAIAKIKSEKIEPVFSVNLNELHQFWQSTAGQDLWWLERAFMMPNLSELVGQHALEFNFASNFAPFDNIHHSMQWRAQFKTDLIPSTLVCHPALLPLEDESIDLVLAYHMLEILTYPHVFLRELARITTHNGRLIIIGWQPFSWSGLKKIWPPLKKYYPYAAKWYRVQRLKDWLKFVDFEIEKIDFCAYSLFHSGKKWQSELRRVNVPFAQSYIIYAKRKRVSYIPLSNQITRRLQNLLLPPIAVKPCTSRETKRKMV